MAENIATTLLHAPAARRLLFTAGALLVYRLGCQIPLPGLDPDTVARLNGVLTGERVSIFALGVTPFLSALIVLELIKLLIPPFGRWETRQPGNARRLGLFAYFAGLVMAGFQARGVANALGGIPGLFKEPGWETVIAITLVAGTALLGWLAERITALGLGNGFWLLVITPTLVNLPRAATGSIDLVQRGAVMPEMLAVAIAFLAIGTALAVTAAQADMTSHEHRMSGAVFVGVWPPLFASYISPLRGGVPRVHARRRRSFGGDGGTDCRIQLAAGKRRRTRHVAAGLDHHIDTDRGLH
jgi:preprotein translocase subunit SecY